MKYTCGQVETQYRTSHIALEFVPCKVYTGWFNSTCSLCHVKCTLGARGCLIVIVVIKCTLYGISLCHVKFTPNVN